MHTHTHTLSHTHTHTHTHIQDQKKEVKKSYQRLLKIFDLLEETLLSGRKEKKLHQLGEGASSKIVESNQQLVSNTDN